MSKWLVRDRQEPNKPGEAVCRYAAYFSVLTQACQLGDHGVLEEPQTDALYGLLASTFWHARALDDAYWACPRKKDKWRSGAMPGRRYWLHQRKPEEAKSGFDFGIITSCVDDCVKVTLFQAKRPAEAGRPLKLSLNHMVRQADGIAIHDFPKKWKQSRAAVEEEINQANMRGNVQQAGDWKEKRQKLKRLHKQWKTYALPQSKAISKIYELLDNGKTAKEVLKAINDDAQIAAHITLTGRNSLFTRPYSYRQHDAFLVTAIRGWRIRNAVIPSNGWCHYAQWVNRSAGEPWSVPLEHASTLGDNEQDGGKRQRFAEVLGASLSSEDQTVGLIIPSAELENLIEKVMDDLPGLVWGAVADKPDTARKLLLQCGVPEKEIVPHIGQAYPMPVTPVQQPDSELGNGDAPRRSPRSPDVKF